MLASDTIVNNIQLTIKDSCEQLNVYYVEVLKDTTYGNAHNSVWYETERDSF